MLLRIFFFIIFSIIGNTVLSQKPIELGDVNWYRSYDEALAYAQSVDKPIFMLFQEVPGCSTCQRYGKQVLQHPLIVEALEDEFVPLAIYNNKQGEDEKTLKKFKEPSWNNPVARIIASDEKAVLPRLNGQYTPYDVVTYMIEALIADKRTVPGYLALLQEELLAKKLGTKETYISMFCYWSGEKNIAKQRGVVYTEAGFMDGKEVVKVRYAPDLVDFKTIVERAQSAQCASGVYSDDKQEKSVAARILGKSKLNDTQAYRKAHDDKYYLSKSDIFKLELTDLQRTRINSMIGERLDPTALLSPRQLQML